MAVLLFQFFDTSVDIWYNILDSNVLVSFFHILKIIIVIGIFGEISLNLLRHKALSKYSNLATVSQGLQKLKYPFIVIVVLFQIYVLINVAFAGAHINPPFLFLFPTIVGIFILFLGIFFLVTGIR